MSSSVSPRRLKYGIGGSSGRPFPWCRPVFIVAMNISSVQSPRPVSLSGVRLAVKLTPHGPDHAVMVPEAFIAHGPGGRAGAGGITRSAGWPLSLREKSCSGPFGPIFHGVWQSLHPPNHTRYSPRAIRSALAAGATVSAGDVARASIVENSVMVRIRNGIVRRLLNIVISFVDVTTPTLASRGRGET